MKISAYLLLMISILSFSTFTVGNEKSDGEQLLFASCQALAVNSEQENAKPCIYFIQGFLAFPQVIDIAIVDEQGEQSSTWWSSFMERVYRTRGVKKGDQIPPARLIPFCVPDDEPKTLVINKVSKQLSSQIDKTKTLGDMIYKALKTEYPCEKPSVKVNEASNGG